MKFPNPSSQFTYKPLPTENVILYDIEANSLRPSKIWMIKCYSTTERKLYTFEPSEKEIREVLSGEYGEDVPFETIKKECYEKGFPTLSHLNCNFTQEFIEFFKQNQNCVWVAHNGIGFDNPVIDRLILKPVGLSIIKTLDTVVLSRLLRFDPPYKLIEAFNKRKLDTRVGGHSLKAWGSRLGFPKDDFSGDNFEKGFSFEMSEYCTQDVRVLVKTYLYLVKENSLYKHSYESILLEHRAAKILQGQQEHGFTLDVPQAQALLKETDALLEEYMEELQKIFPPKRKVIRVVTPRINTTTGKMHATDAKTLSSNLHEKNPDGTYTLFYLEEFNPNSSHQVVDRFKDLGWTPVHFTDKGNPRVGKDILPGIIKSLVGKHPEAQAMERWNIVYNRNMKARTWLELSQETGKMHGTCFHIGAWTQRCSHRNDNMANVSSVQGLKIPDVETLVDLEPFETIPSGEHKGHLKSRSDDSILLTGLKGTYGWECRNCWTVSDQSKFTMVGCDASGIQLRALGHYLHPFDQGEYAREVIDGDIHKKNQKAAGIIDRPTAKTFIYAWLLGGGDPKIGEIVGVSSSDIAKFKQNKSLVMKKKAAFEYQNITPTQKMVWEACKGFSTKEAFLNNIPALRQFKDETIAEAAALGWMEGLDGRKIHVPSKHLAMGAYLQGFEAVIMKQAMYLYHKEAKAKGLYVQQVNFVHDEYCVEALHEEADEVGKTIVQAIKDAGTLLGTNCEMDGEYHTGRSWAYVH